MGTSQAARTAAEVRFERAIDRMFGVISAGTATNILDVSPATLRSRAHRGQLVRVSQGVYAHPDATLVGLTELMAVTLWPTTFYPGEALIVGETAAYLRLGWDWDDEMCLGLADVALELAFPEGFRTHRPPPIRYDSRSRYPVRFRHDLFPRSMAGWRRTTGMFHRRFRVQHAGPALRACVNVPGYDQVRLRRWAAGGGDIKRGLTERESSDLVAALAMPTVSAPVQS